jgi:hypothetical protein
MFTVTFALLPILKPLNSAIVFPEPACISIEAPDVLMDKEPWETFGDESGNVFGATGGTAAEKLCAKVV